MRMIFVINRICKKGFLMKENRRNCMLACNRNVNSLSLLNIKGNYLEVHFIQYISKPVCTIK